MNQPNIYTTSRLFTGDEWITDAAVITNQGIIEEVLPVHALPRDAIVIDFPNGIMVPAFIDFQIYGAYERLFAVFPEADSLAKLNAYCNSGGAAYCVPTVATNALDVFYKAIDAIRVYWEQGGQGILGLHIEGPWINPIKRGAHIEAFIHSPSLQEVRDFLDYGRDVIKVITLAPEVCSKEVVDLILSRGIVVSAGHSNATYKQAMEAFNGGIKTATHLYNAMSPLQHREPGLVGAVFNHQNVCCSVIPDGHHVDYEAIRIAKKLMGSRLFAITDAVTTTTEGYYQHYMQGDKYEAGGILSGSALTMNKACRNLVNQVDVDLDEALKMCSYYPAVVLGLQHELGKISKGYQAKMAVMDTDFEIIKLIV